ncbi:MAG TPA: hypothetical protein VJ765_08885 [Chitinophagaceae bacterium]|nr:hypothetical protein [Chitinophagaceae bacterium]
MFKTDDFEVASKKFRAIYNSLQQLSAGINGATAIFKGDYSVPAGSLKFTNIVFDSGDKIPEIRKLKMALLSESEMPELAIKIQVYEKEREDKDRGREID